MTGIAPVTIEIVLVPLDGSEQAEVALPYAQALAGATGKLILLAVVPLASDVRNVFGRVISSPQQVEQGYEKVAQAYLARAEARLHGRPTISRQVVTGDPIEEIVKAAQQAEADVIVMTTHGGGAWGPTANEHVVAGVIDRARPPVLVVNSNPSSSSASLPGTTIAT